MDRLQSLLHQQENLLIRFIQKQNDLQKHTSSGMHFNLCNPTYCRVAAVYGGIPTSEQFKSLKAGAEIVVGTPVFMLSSPLRFIRAV